MKRTYADILGEYYDNQSDSWEMVREVVEPKANMDKRTREVQYVLFG